MPATQTARRPRLRLLIGGKTAAERLARELASKGYDPTVTRGVGSI